MSKLNARVVAEALAAVGVIVSLVFVGLEVRQNTAAAKAQAYQEIGLAVAAAWSDAAKDSELMELRSRARSPDSAIAASVTGTDLDRVLASFVASLRYWEIVYLNIEVGTLGPEAMDQMGNWLRICVDPFLSREWEAVKSYLGEAFGQYVAETCGLTW